MPTHESARAVTYCVALAVMILGIGCAQIAQAKRDKRAPSAPESLQVTSFSAQDVALSWEPSSDNAGPPAYVVSISDGREISVGAGTTSLRITTGFTPSTTYSFSVQAIDAAGNRSRSSKAVSVTLPPSPVVDEPEPAPAEDPDSTPSPSGAHGAPSTPPRFSAIEDYCGDVFLVWKPSTDDHDSERDLVYDVYVDGTLTRTVSERTWTLLTLNTGGVTTFEVVAVDTDGNESVPALDTLDLERCDF